MAQTSSVIIFIPFLLFLVGLCSTVNQHNIHIKAFSGFITPLLPPYFHTRVLPIPIDQGILGSSHLVLVFTSNMIRINASGCPTSTTTNNVPNFDSEKLCCLSFFFAFSVSFFSLVSNSMLSNNFLKSLNDILFFWCNLFQHKVIRAVPCLLN